MRTISIEPQEYLNYGIVNKLSYEILPFIENESEGLFPFNYILYYDENEVVNSIGYMTPEELDDWSVYRIMDEKIEGKLNLSFIQNNMYFKNNTNIELNDKNVDATPLINENVDSKIKFSLIKYLINVFLRLKNFINKFIK